MTIAKRLLADAAAVSGQPAPAMAADLLQRVRAFAGKAPQSDDIAILALSIGHNGASAPSREGAA